MIANMKTFDKLVEFKHSFVKNGFYSKHFQEINKLGSGSFGSVFKVEVKQDSDYYETNVIEDLSQSVPDMDFDHLIHIGNYIFDNSNFDIDNKKDIIKQIRDLSKRGNEMFHSLEKPISDIFEAIFKVRTTKKERDYSAIKRIDFGPPTSDVRKDEIIREYLNYKIMTTRSSQNKYIVRHFDAWFEESIDQNIPKISLYIQMELCDKTLDGVIQEFDSHLKTNGTLTPLGYYIASQIFIQVLQGVNHLHTRNPPLIHRDLKPANILLKKHKVKGLCVKIADFGLIAIHECLGQSHSKDKGTLKYMAPEVDIGEYDTKADIYSMGVIFENLFALQSIE
jgi:serine/threonine protein kinase